MRNFKKLALVGAFVVTTAFSVTACGSSNGTTQEATTVDSQAEQDSCDRRLRCGADPGFLYQRTSGFFLSWKKGYSGNDRL